jgi:hypothetical protein
MSSEKFKKYHKNIGLPENKLKSFFDSVKELDPYIEYYYFKSYLCYNTELYHLNVIFTFNKNIDLDNISEECKNLWNLSDLPNTFKKDIIEMSKNGCSTITNIPKISRPVPILILKDIVDDINKYHLFEDFGCF